VNLTDLQIALRARALTLSVATTGSATLVATATGYTRASGSFVTDGFVAGMEILPAGFTTNTPRVIQSVAAGTLVVRGSVTPESSGASRSLTCGLPSLRGWDNQRVTLIADRWAVEEEFIQQPGRLRTFPAASGQMELRGLYILRVYVVQGPGLAAGRRWADALLELFLPESTLAVTGGDTVRIRGELTPSVSGYVPAQAGWSAFTVSVPWWALVTNA